MTIAGIVRTPRDSAGRTLTLQLVLLDAEGTAIPIQLINGAEVESIEGKLQPIGHDDPSLGTPLEMAFAIGVPPFALEAGRAFRWQAYLDGETQTVWNVPFRTTPPEPLAG
jgi:hypothetical protein